MLFAITNYSKILRPKNQKHFIKDFLIYTKFKPKRIENLQDQEFISSELYFSIDRAHPIAEGIQILLLNLGFPNLDLGRLVVLSK